jgi:uncharacterized heparinase superfamily protein
VSLALALRTLPYLRREQLTYRPWRIAQYRLYRALPSLTRRWVSLEEAAPAASEQAVDEMRTLLGSSFRHLNFPLDQIDGWLAAFLDGRYTWLNRTLSLPSVDWNSRYESHLWNYQLHYFGYAVWCARSLVERGDERAMRRCQALIEEWMERARPGVSDGWEPYPVSLRVVNWIYAYALLTKVYDDSSFMDRWRAGIYRQLDFLRGHLEHHHLANHLLKNVKALVVGGLFFGDGRSATDWLDTGRRLLWRELDEQVLADGGHFERSPMYHALALADFVECFALLRALDGEPEGVSERIESMTRFLRAMSYGNDALALFNDSANLSESRPCLIVKAAEELCGSVVSSVAGVESFEKSGYFTWKSLDGSERIIVDCGPPAADYNMAHAHCDVLSYELRMEGRPLVVDSGVHGYDGDEFREYCRSTRAHNTVSFDGREQSELWGTFRGARRAEILSAQANGDSSRFKFRGSYSPFYDRGLKHEREICREENGDWVVTDSVTGVERSRAISFVHVHPDVVAREIDGTQIELRLGDSVFFIEPFGCSEVTIVIGRRAPAQGWYFPDFGVALPSATIEFTCDVRPSEPFGYRIRLAPQAIRCGLD